jgi:excisionase family DNA binding protein
VSFLKELDNELKVYTLKEVAEILQVTRRTIYNYIKDGKLKAFKMGKYWRVRHEDLKEFISSPKK